MVYFFYHHDYVFVLPRDSGGESNNISTGTVKIPRPNLLHHARVYALAEKYGIPSLRSTAVEKFRSESQIWWRHAEFAEAARVVYTATPDDDSDMRDVVMGTIRANRDLLNDDPVCSGGHTACV